jgi:hypothetical protein
VEAYSPPYFDIVGPEPSLDEMHQVVCVDKRRPRFPTPAADPAVRSVSNLTEECWFASANARPNAYRAKKTLAELRQAGLRMRKASEDSAEEDELKKNLVKIV